MGLTPNSASLTPSIWSAAMPIIRLPGGEKIERPHIEWTLHQIRWRWLLDSWEGGEAYRMAIYGYTIDGQPIRNLIRHKREYPSSFETTYSTQTGRPPGTDQATQATEDDYELRRARTPVPTFVADVVKDHLAKIYKREVDRDGPAAMEKFWQDVDGKGADIDCWFQSTIAPLLMTLGCLDLVVDRPAVPDGELVKTRADETRLKLDTVRASYILPENMMWWRLDPNDEYLACVVREPRDDGEAVWRYWDAQVWRLFDYDGRQLAEGAHNYGRVPIVRVFDHKRPRYRNIGLPRYEAIAEMQREYYNRDSELILSDSTQAHPLMQGPEDYIQPDGTIPVGPAWLLPMKKGVLGANVSYQGFEVIEFPKAGAESIRLNKQDLRDAVDRAALLTKPAGAQGTTGKTVSQSGISKRLDQSAGNDLLGDIAKKLCAAECALARLATTVQGATYDETIVKVQYPTEFDLFTPDELAMAVTEFQAIVAQAGSLPETEGELLCKLVRLMLPGMDDDEYDEFDTEIEAYLAEQAKARSMQAEMMTSPGEMTPNDMGEGETPMSPGPNREMMNGRNNPAAAGNGNAPGPGTTSAAGSDLVNGG